MNQIGQGVLRLGWVKQRQSHLKIALIVKQGLSLLPKSNRGRKPNKASQPNSVISEVKGGVSGV